MYYQLWCLQNNQYMHTGRNSENLKDLKEDFIDYISVDFEDDKKDRKHYSKIDIYELVDMWEMEIKETKEKISEDDCGKLSIATYYKPSEIIKGFGLLYDDNGNEIDEKERGLTGKCSKTKKYHRWLLLPKEKGQKQYLMCLDCLEHTHT